MAIVMKGVNLTTVEALKNLAVVLGCASSVEDIDAETTAEVIQFIADNYTV